MPFIRRHAKQLAGAALAGCGWALMEAAPHVYNDALILPFSAGGLVTLIFGIRMLWIAWKKSSDEADDRRKPPSIL